MAEEQKIVKPYIKPLAVTTAVSELVKENPKRCNLIVYNVGAATVYILSAQNQKAADGIPVVAAASYSNDDVQGALWIVTAASTADVRVEEDSCI